MRKKEGKAPPLLAGRRGRSYRAWAVWTLVATGLFLLALLTYLCNYAWLCGWRLEWSNPRVEARFILLADPQMEGKARVLRQGLYGQFNNALNDYYFRFIYSRLLNAASPVTHTFLLGDLFSYQRTREEDFNQRLERYSWAFVEPALGLKTNLMLVNLSGNHDIGYAAELDHKLVSRFENAFGPVNAKYEVAGHVLGVVNAQNIDASANQELHEETWQHIHRLEESSKHRPLLLFVHIPLHKDVPYCDSPETITNANGHIKEQKYLEPDSTKYLLEHLRPRFIFSGHDHEGCTYAHNEHTTEYTLRSVMGDYGGHASLFEIISTADKNKAAQNEESYRYNYVECPFIPMRYVVGLLVAVIVWTVCLCAVLIAWCIARCLSMRKQQKLDYRPP